MSEEISKLETKKKPTPRLALFARDFMLGMLIFKFIIVAEQAWPVSDQSFFQKRREAHYVFEFFLPILFALSMTQFRFCCSKILAKNRHEKRNKNLCTKFRHEIIDLRTWTEVFMLIVMFAIELTNLAIKDYGSHEEKDRQNKFNQVIESSPFTLGQTIVAIFAGRAIEYAKKKFDKSRANTESTPLLQS